MGLFWVLVGAGGFILSGGEWGGFVLGGGG